MARISTAAEDAAVQALTKGTTLKLPHPSESETAKLASMGVVFKGKFDRVLSTFEVPPGWQLRSSERDSRHNELVNAEGKLIAHVFLKHTSYDYYGSFRMVKDGE